MSWLEHISYLAGLLAVGVIVFRFSCGSVTERRKHHERKRLEVLLGGKR